MKLYNLGKIPWHETQTIYHALARSGREALSLVSPETPYVCIGFHQDAEQEVDMEFCRDRGIPVFRREVGGGAVYLDGDQLFFQLILKRKNPIVPRSKEAFYKKFLQPVINTYRHIGIQAEYKPVNDVVAGNRKISGTGAAEIGDCIVFVGNLIVDFNYDMMSRVLRVPDEKFRDKVHKTLRENLSTIRRELGPEEASKWDESTLNKIMADEFARVAGPMEPAAKDRVLQEKMDSLEEEMNNDPWLYQTRRKGAGGREVKISAGAQVLQRVHKARGGLIRADLVVKEGKFQKVYFSGDFFCFPEKGVEWLERSLQGREVWAAGSVVERWYEEKGIETPGIQVDDWMKILKV
ncbi:MAG: lipoate--protein ligase family protein [Deltaproteobacteria bacterium]|nr:lipoate--protein ligase family protein [Deltaproteobacteria bacterium]